MFSKQPKFEQNREKLPRRNVSPEEFITLFIDNGGTQEEAELQATLCSRMGSSCLVGKEWLSINKESK